MLPAIGVRIGRVRGVVCGRHVLPDPTKRRGVLWIRVHVLRTKGRGKLRQFYRIALSREGPAAWYDRRGEPNSGLPRVGLTDPFSRLGELVPLNGASMVITGGRAVGERPSMLCLSR